MFEMYPEDHILVLFCYRQPCNYFTAMARSFTAAIGMPPTFVRAEVVDSIKGGEAPHAFIVLQGYSESNGVSDGHDGSGMKCGFFGLERDTFRFYMSAMRGQKSTSFFIAGEIMKEHISRVPHRGFKAQGAHDRAHLFWKGVDTALRAHRKNLFFEECNVEIPPKPVVLNALKKAWSAMPWETLQKDTDVEHVTRMSPQVPQLYATLEGIHQARESTQDVVEYRTSIMRSASRQVQTTLEDDDAEHVKDIAAGIATWNKIAVSLLVSQPPPKQMQKGSYPTTLMRFSEYLIDCCLVDVIGHNMWQLNLPFLSWPTEEDMKTVFCDGTLLYDVVLTLWTLAKGAGPWLGERASPHIEELRYVKKLHKGGDFTHKGSYHVWKACGQTRIAHCLETPQSDLKLKVYTGGYPRCSHSTELVLIVRDQSLLAAALQLPSYLTLGRITFKDSLITVRPWSSEDENHKKAMTTVSELNAGMAAFLSSLSSDEFKGLFLSPRSQYLKSPNAAFSNDAEVIYPTEIVSGLWLGSHAFATSRDWLQRQGVDYVVTCSATGVAAPSGLHDVEYVAIPGLCLSCSRLPKRRL